MKHSCICREMQPQCQEMSTGSATIRSTLFDDIKRMQSDDAYLDMEFVCGSQEEEVGACRMLVAARSPVLQSMLLTSGMTESWNTRIALPHIQPSVMRVCLEFFHTDTVQESSWTDISLVMHVLEAAMFFLVKPLQILALAYLRSAVKNNNMEDANWWASLVTSYNLAVELFPSHSSNQDEKSYQCCLYRFIDSFHLFAYSRWRDINPFSGSDIERNFYKGLTEAALFHCIRGMKWEDHVDGLSQYLSFLLVVRWIAYRVVARKPSIDEGEFKEMLNKCFPQSSQMMRTLPFNDREISRCMKLLAGPLADCLKRAPLDFAKMPPHILCNFIEPLDILSPSTILAAYRCQALRRPDLKWDGHAHGTQYKLVKCDPTVISCSSSRLKGFARCNTYLNVDTDLLFDWEVVICKPCAELRIGFVACGQSDTVSVMDSHVLGDGEWSWALGADGFLYNSGQKSSTPYASAFVKKSVVIQVQLDMIKESCSFCIDDKEAGVAWSGLPLADEDCAFYPAISLVAPGEAEIHMVHHSSMDRPSKKMCLTSEATSDAAAAAGPRGKS